MNDWLLKALSIEQQKPFSNDKQNANILAAAGSGKTRTLVHLLAADLIADIPASEIVAFTFTEKAADELLARIHMIAKEYLPEKDLTGIYIGTIHSWCLQYLYSQADFYNFTPIDELHTDALVSRLYDVLGLEAAYNQSYPKGVEPFLADLEIFYNEHLSLSDVPQDIQSSINIFLTTLHANRLMTFGGMVRYAAEHLLSNGPLKNLKSLYVDEYQDVNPAQVALIKAMLPTNGKVTVVGDDLQCIYNWRGSDITRILNFDKEFDNASTYRLSTNYRSRPSIVQISNRIAEKVSLRDPDKVMLEGRPDVSCESIHWYSLDSDTSQANTVADIVESFVAQGVPWNKIAILLRSVVGSGQFFIDALNARNIPVYCPILSRGGQFINQFLLPILDWLRSEHREPKNELEEAEFEQKAIDLWLNVSTWINAPNAEAVFWESLNHWREAIERKQNDAYDIRGKFYDFLNRCEVHITIRDHNLTVGLGIASQIIRSVEEIHRRRIQGQKRRTPKGIISEVFFALIRNQQAFGESIPLEANVDGVIISTVHQAKGLEWPIVILPMLMSRRFPLSSKGHGTSFPDTIAQRYGTSLEDERRLFYVAVTRAKERLFLLDSANQRPRKRSVFLTDLQSLGAISISDLSSTNPLVWEIDESDLKDPDPSPLRVGLSDLLLYIECPYQFGLRRIAGIQPSVGDELGFGKGLHELIQRRGEAKKQWTPQELSEQVKSYVHLPYMSEQGEAQSRQAIEKRLKSLEALGAFSAPVEQEVDVEVLFNGGVVHGIIDSLQLEPSGEILVRDWKSNIHDDFVPRYERQLQFYANALSLQGRVVSKADIVDVAASTKKGEIVMKEIDISNNTISTLMANLQQSIDNIVAGKFPATPSEASCKCCDMKRICGERYRSNEEA